MKPEIEDDADLASAYRAWVSERTGDLPGFAALAPKREARSKVITLPRAIAALGVAAALVLSLTLIAHQLGHRPTATSLDSELAMPWPSDTDFLLNWADASATEFDIQSFSIDSKQSP